VQRISRNQNPQDRIDSRLPSGIQRDLIIVAISALIWGLGEGLFIFFLPLTLQRWNANAVQIGGVLSMIGVTMAVAFSRSLVKVADTGLAYGLVETGNALAVAIAPLAAGLLYNYRPEAVYIASLGALAVTVVLNMWLFHEKRNMIAPDHYHRNETN
jgi:hypothetical protein